LAIILLSEYAERHNKAQRTVIDMANRGSLKTARKIGRQWFIEEDEPYPDNRIKSGKYIDWKTRPRSRKNKKSSDI